VLLQHISKPLKIVDELCWGNDWDADSYSEREEIIVSSDDEVSSSFNGTINDHVVSGVANNNGVMNSGVEQFAEGFQLSHHYSHKCEFETKILPPQYGPSLIKNLLREGEPVPAGHRCLENLPGRSLEEDCGDDHICVECSDYH